MLSDSDRGDLDSPTAIKPQDLGSGDEFESAGSAFSKPKKGKGPKPPKSERKKDKPWKTGAAGGEGNSEAVNNDLKLNVNPTERPGGEDGQQAADGQKAADGEEGANGQDAKAGENDDESPEDDEKKDDEEDEEAAEERRKAEAAAAAEAAARAQEEAVQAKREMERILLTKEVRAMKEKMLDFVNDIIVRQNRQDPVANFESFINETAARRVLKELLAEFTTAAEDVRKRTTANEDKLKVDKAKLEKHEALIKKIQEKADTVDTFNKRLLQCENKLDTFKEQSEQRHESMKDFVQRTKDMLESRVDQITQYNSRLEAMNDEITRLKDMTNAFKDAITGQMNNANENVARLEGVLNEFMEQQRQFYGRTEFWNDEKTKSLVDLNKRLDQLNQVTTDKFTEVEFSISQRIRIDDMRQNFGQLNDVLAVKFRQVEDTKQAVRSLIAYQKYYHNIQTQQMIMESLMRLRVARNDRDFVTFVKTKYEELVDATQARYEVSKGEKDVDLEEHIKELTAKRVLGGDWHPFPMKDIQTGCDFVHTLLERYLEDLNNRRKLDEFGVPPVAVTIRKSVHLDELETVIEQVQKKALELALDAGHQAEKLQEEYRLREIQENIKRLARKKLDFRHREAAKRQHSFKGRDRDPLFEDQGDKDEFKDRLRSPKPPRAKSRELNKKERLRVIQREYMIDFDQGAEKRGSALSQSQLSDMNQDSTHRQSEDGGDHRGRDGSAMQGGIMQSGVGQVGDGGQGGPVFDAAAKAQFVQEIRTDLKPMITQIAHEQSEKGVRPLKSQLDDYFARNDERQKQMVEKFETELLKLADYYKKQIAKVNTDFATEIRALQRQNARNRSDFDQAISQLTDRLQGYSDDLARHQSYHETLAQMISMLAENINMQMEAEYADLFDRKMMALYGAKPGKASRIDMNTKLDSKTRGRDYKSPGPDLEDFDNDHSAIAKRSQRKALNADDDMDSGDGSDDEGAGEAERMASVDNVNVDGDVSRMDQVSNVPRRREQQREAAKGVPSPSAFDDIRQTSGAELKRDEMTIAIDNKCLSHQNSGLDTHLTLKMFKIACLAYKPSNIQYRELVLDRKQMIQLRRGLIDRLTNLQPLCDLFQAGAFYPRRYFDDLMIDDRGPSGKLSKAETQLMSFHRHVSSSTHAGSDSQQRLTVADQQAYMMSHSHTQGMALNSNSSKILHLPDINQHGPNLAFGVSQRGHLEANSDLQNQAALRNRNQSMTLDIGGRIVGQEASGDDNPSMQYLGKQRVDGMYSTRNRSKFNQSDIKRNASVAVVNSLGATPQLNKLINSSRKQMIGHDPGLAMASTVAQLANRERVLERGAAELIGRSSSKKNAASEFHKRHHSTIGEPGLNIEVDGYGVSHGPKGFRSTRPSVSIPSTQGPLKPKVSFEIPGPRR